MSSPSLQLHCPEESAGEHDSDSAETTASESESGGWRIWTMLVPRRNANLEKTISVVLALWHTYMIWIGSCAFACASLVVVLSWHVQWYSFFDGDDSDLHFTMRFLATFTKSWLLIAITSDLLHFCYLLVQDAWREDAFEAYRRAVCGGAFSEVYAGQLYICGWPYPLSTTSKWIDAILQVCIYISLDVFPLFLFLYESVFAMSSGEAHFGGYFVLTQASLSVTCIHVFMFFTSWSVSEICLKVTALRMAAGGERIKISTKGSATRMVEITLADRSESEVDINGVVFEDVAFSHMLSEELTEENQTTAPARRTLRRRPTQLNATLLLNQISHVPTLAHLHGKETFDVCVPVGSTSSALLNAFPYCVVLTTVVMGFVYRKIGVSIVAFIAGFILFLMKQEAEIKCESTFLLFAFGARCWNEGLDHLHLLCDWGDKFCDLNYDAQLRNRTPFMIMAFLFGVVAAACDWPISATWCILILSAASCCQLCVKLQRPWTWLFGICESFILALICLAIFYASPLEAPWKDTLMAVFFFTLRQFGLGKSLETGQGMRWTALVGLACFQFALVAVISFCIVSRRQLATESKFCDPKAVNCSYYPVAYQGQFGGRWPLCQMDFSDRLSGEFPVFTLADFALMSAISYEPIDKLPTVLQQFFPHWRVTLDHQGHVNRTGMNHDWSTFYEFTSPGNSTTVFAVRGTLDAFDALQDLVLWLPVSMMYLFERIGPNVVQEWGAAMAWLCRAGYFMESSAFQISFYSLLDQVRLRLASHPERAFYITGHSLGGGVAKLVAAQIERERQLHRYRQSELSAIAFASPGIGVAEALIFGYDRRSTNRFTSLTVRPHNDLISRIDQITGTIIPVDCVGSPWHCHSIYPTLCGIYKRCGSMRPSSDLSIPCGWCPDMPCP